MNRKIKIAGALMMGALLIGWTVSTIHAARDDGNQPEVTADGVLVHAGLNVEPGMDGVVEGSVSFMANVPFKKIVDNMLKPGTLGKLSPNIANYSVTSQQDTGDFLVYKIEEDVVPLKVPLVNMSTSKVYQVFKVNKRALADNVIAVNFDLDPDKPNQWKRLSGRIYGVDLHNGYTMVMVATSTRSHYDMLDSIRLKLVKMVLSKTKDNIVSWLNSLN